MSDTPWAMDLKTAAAHLGTEVKTIRDAIDREQLPARRIGPKGVRWSVLTADLQDWYLSLSRERRDDA